MQFNTWNLFYSRLNLFDCCCFLSFAFFVFTSCNDYNNNNDKAIPNPEDVNQPATATVKPPAIVYLDSCPSPQVIAIADDYRNQGKTSPPEKKQAGFYLNMPNYTMENGLPLSAILCGYCDKAGNIWFGTDGGGACRYDGKSYVTFNTSHGLADNHLWFITEDSKGNMWFATNGGGVSCYDGKSFITLTEKNGLVNNHVRNIFEDKTGHLWFACNTGLSRLNLTSNSNRNSLATGSRLFTNFTIDNGLLANAVTSMAQDDKGNIWLGSAKGVNCYNPETLPHANSKSFTSFTTDDGLVNNNVTFILKDSHANLWFVTTDGVSLLAGDELKKNLLNNNAKLLNADTNTFFENQVRSFINFKSTDGMVSDFIKAVMEDKKGNIWFCSKGGVNYFNSTALFRTGFLAIKNITTAQGLILNDVKSITEDKQGHLWFGTYGAGVNRYDGNAFEFCSTEHGLVNNAVTCFANDKNGNVWIGTDGGLSIYNTGGIESFQTVASPHLKNTAGKKINTQAVQTFTNYTTMQGLAGNQIRNIYPDKRGNIWIAIVDGGVSKFEVIKKSIIKNIPDVNSHKQHYANSVNLTNDYSITNYNVANGLISRNVRCILEDKAGHIWFATNAGISRYNANIVKAKGREEAILASQKKELKKSFTNYTQAHGLPDNMVYCMAEDRKGNLWFGTQSGGVSCYDGNRVEAIENEIKLNDTTDLKKVNGRFVKTFTNYNTAQGLGNNCVFRIREDEKGNLWFATYGGGLCRYHRASPGNTNDKLFLNFTDEHGLADNSVYDFVFDKKGNIVAGTNLGFSVLTKFELKNNSESKSSLAQSVAAINDLTNEQLKKYYQPVFEQYNKRTGYPVKDIVNGSMYCDSSGIIWAGGGDDKLVRFNPDLITKNNKPSEVVIQNIKVNEENICWSCLLNKNSISEEDNTLSEQVLVYGKTLTGEQKDSIQLKYSHIRFDSVAKFYPLPVNLELDYKHNNITFDYTAIEPATASLIKYQYILEGYNSEWNPVTNKTTASFGNISEGTYTFKLKALNNSEVWSNPVTYSFTVLPPWYRSKWAYTAYIILFLAAGWSFIKWREIKIKEKSGFEKRIAEVEMQALRSQMNPHFIFNSLHAINKYMLDNDKQNASEYLAGFSSLIRLILENSRHQEVPLEKDLAALELYLQLESLRFQNKFKYTIEVHEELNPETVLIPPMMLQPFVENSILHGIKTKQNGLIQIKIRKIKNMVSCVIQDNGVGRNRNVSGDAAKGKKHESLAIKITEERLHIIDQLKKVKTSIHIVDLKDADNNAAGLRVELILPFEEIF